MQWMLVSGAETFVIAGPWWSAAIFFGLLIFGLRWSVVQWVRWARSEMSAQPATRAAGAREPQVQRTNPREANLGPATALIALTVFGFCVVLNEGPMRVDVKSDALVLRYALPWRDETIPASSIEDVQLLRRSKSRRTLASTWPVLVITRHGERHEIMASNADHYPAVEHAYEAARRMMARKREADRASR